MIWVKRKKNVSFWWKLSYLIHVFLFVLMKTCFLYKKIIIIKARPNKKNSWIYNLNAIEKERIIWENHEKEIYWRIKI
jgi:hypothetical protein